MKFTHTPMAGALALALAASPVFAEGPGQGATARFEVEFMQMTIDHHFAALRITELAAGTDVQRNPDNTAGEGTSPTPGFAVTPAKATLDNLKSMARRNNRMQREEIATLQRFLKDWYAIDYQPKLRDDTKPLVATLEKAAAGAAFDRAYYETFSRHHYMLMEPVNGCMSGSELMHHDLRRECQGMWHSQTADIDMMRNELKVHFGIADYQPFRGLEPLHGTKGGVRGNQGSND